MAANRIQKFPMLDRAPAAKKNAAATIPHGFVLCPLQLGVAAAWQQEIYRLAYQRAQAATQIPRHYRLLFSVWN